MDSTYAELEIHLTPELEHIVGVRYVYVDLTMTHLREWAESNKCYEEHLRALTEGYAAFRVLEILDLTLEDIEIYLQITHIVQQDRLCLKDLLADFLLALRKKVVDALFQASIDNDLITMH